MEGQDLSGVPPCAVVPEREDGNRYRFLPGRNLRGHAVETLRDEFFLEFTCLRWGFAGEIPRQRVKDPPLRVFPYYTGIVDHAEEQESRGVVSGHPDALHPENIVIPMRENQPCRQ